MEVFKTHPDNMRMEPTPERVYAVCKLIASQSLSREQLREYLSLREPSSNNHGEISASIAVATEELGVLQAKDNLIMLMAPSSVLVTPISFRRYVNTKVFHAKDSTFFRFSKWFITQNERIFLLDSWETKVNTAKSEDKGLAGITENAGLGWRFWASFLGLGYLNGTTLIPNMKTRLHDVMATSFTDTYRYEEQIPANEFVSWLSMTVPEADAYQSKSLSMALSAGLRTLHDLSLIHLVAQRDTDRIPMYRVDGEEFNDFSHVTVKEAIAQ